MRLKLGMVGGGEGAFIGAVHRLAARMDDEFELVAGAFSSNEQIVNVQGNGCTLRLNDATLAISKWRKARRHVVMALMWLRLSRLITCMPLLPLNFCAQVST
ncbi:hypothetical protein [uncultured Providencia sp.]|uniref:hypothetical protein n=1 Tax=uncultured Providencia sp. TaxID=390517 RepID=UPI00300FAE6E